jgi:hypothetical protein
VLGLNEASFFDRKDGQHPVTKWIKIQQPADERLLRNRLLSLHRAAKVSSHNRTTVLPTCQEYGVRLFLSILSTLKWFVSSSVFTNGSPYKFPVGPTPVVHNTKIITNHSERKLSSL